MSILRTLLILGFMLFNIISSNAYAIHFPTPPNSNNFYVDAANLIQPNIKNEINQIANKLWQERNIPFFVVTIPSLITQGAIHYTIKDYASALFDFWGIGSREKSYGILLLISKAEHMASIIMGSGWGQALDGKKNNIIKEMVITDFDQLNFSDELLKGVINLNIMTNGMSIPKQSQLVSINDNKSGASSALSLLFKIFIICTVFLVTLVTLNNKSRKRKLLPIKKDEADKRKRL
jgi:uncharacterized protein